MEKQIFALQSQGSIQDFPRFNQSLFSLIEDMKKATVFIEFLPSGSCAIRTVRATLIGYWYTFKRPFTYIPRLMFLPYFDMDLREWRTLQVKNIISWSSSF